MDFFPPPLPTKIAHAVPILHMEFVVEEICHRGGRFATWYYSPPGEVLLWDCFRGKVCHNVFLHGERLPYGIICHMV